MNDKGLVLSLFPGFGLLDAAFEDQGFTVVRGPDLFWGGDIERFSVPSGVFDGIIGGPPCQLFSAVNALLTKNQRQNRTALDLIPHMLRIWYESSARWVVMENVPPVQNHPDLPEEWNKIVVKDWDCGGNTQRRRLLATYPFSLPFPRKRKGTGELSVLATTTEFHHSKASPLLNHHTFLSGDLPIEEYAQLQGVPDFVERLKRARIPRHLACRLLGNGVPYAIGRWAAIGARKFVETGKHTA